MTDKTPDVSTSAEPAAQPGAPAPKRRSTARLVGKLVLLAVVAAIVGAFVTANWRDRSFSLIYNVVDIKAGIVILASVGLGFLLAIVFLWSAFNRE